MTSKRVVATRDQAMRFVVTTGSGHEVVVDDGISNTGARPTEFVLVGLAACTGMDVIAILEKKRQPPEAYSIRVEAVQREEYPQVLTRIEIVHEIVGASVNPLAVRRAIELSALKYCPVNAMLSAGDTAVHHRFTLRAASETEPVADEEVVVTGPFRAPDIIAG